MTKRKFENGTIVIQFDNLSKLFVVTDYYEYNDMYHVRDIFYENSRDSAEFASTLRAVTLIDLCNVRSKIDGIIQDFVKKSSK